MPGISMCSNSTCEARKRCHRHEESGTQPCEWRQSYQGWGAFEATPACEGFWPKTDWSLPPRAQPMEASHDRT